MLGSIDDPRDPRGRQYRIEVVLAVIVVATPTGAKNYAEIARRAADMPQELLREIGSRWDWFRLCYRWPSWSVIRAVLTGIDGNEMDGKVGRWLFAHTAREGNGGFSLSLDGKVMRGAWTDDNDQFTLFSAMMHREAITIAQVSVPAGTTETTQASTLLEAVDAIGIPVECPVLITLDAAHTCQETAREITSRTGMDYMMNVKENCPQLQRKIFAKLAPLTTGAPHSIITERSRGKIRKWSSWVTGMTQEDGISFPGVRQATLIRRDVAEISGQPVSKEIALMITSREAGRMTAREVNKKAREHWVIENKSHYPRDTTYREDHNQSWAGQGPQNLASTRNLAISLIRRKGINAIKETTEWIAADRMEHSSS
ncbi:MAG: ISAs1 family transposase [Pseudonocardiales bacterium]